MIVAALVSIACAVAAPLNGSQQDLDSSWRYLRLGKLHVEQMGLVDLVARLATQAHTPIHFVCRADVSSVQMTLSVDEDAILGDALDAIAARFPSARTRGTNTGVLLIIPEGKAMAPLLEKSQMPEFTGTLDEFMDEFISAKFGRLARGAIPGLRTNTDMLTIHIEQAPQTSVLDSLVQAVEDCEGRLSLLILDAGRGGKCNGHTAVVRPTLSYSVGDMQGYRERQERVKSKLAK